MTPKIYFFTFLTIILFRSSLPALEPVTLTDSKEEYPLGLNLEILEDKDRKWKIEDAASPAFFERFIKSDCEIPNYGFTENAYWVRFTLVNESSKNEWLLEAGYPLLDRIELFTPAAGARSNAGQTYTVRKAGESFPFKQREIKHQNCVFHLRPPAGEEITYYIRFQSTGSMQLPLTVYSSVAFAEKDHEERILLGLYYGIITALLLYNLFLFFSLRDKNYLYYVLYLANYALVQLSLNGIAFEYLWPGYPWWSNISMPFLISVLLIWLSRFASNILISRVYAPKIDKFFSSLFLFSAAGMLWSLFWNYYAACYISIGTTLVFIPVALVAGIISWRKGYRPARFFVMAWSAFLCGSFIYILRAFGLIPNNFITTYGIQIGSTLEVVLLSLALADRINIMRQEKEEAQALAIENLHKADKLKDEFLANTSHELKTPLNGIIGIAESMMDRKVSQDQRMRLSMILSSGKRLLNLVNDILDLSKLKHHDIVLQTKALDMKQIADLVVILSGPLLAGKPVVLENLIQDGTPPVLGDENRIQQIMYNLVGNAVKFTGSGSIKISAAEIPGDGQGNGAAGFLEIRVSDTGIGIPPEKLEAIFEPFEQAETSVSRMYGGTGLGLSITKQLIELHGGSIRAESGEGKGSDFIFTLPLCAKEQADAMERNSEIITALVPDAAAESADFGPLRTAGIENGARKILAVDDDPVNLQVLSDQLSLNEYSVYQALSGFEAMEAVEKGNYDLVLLDVMMPKMSGYEVCRRLRDKYSANELPVIMLTARDRVSDLIEGLDAGANDYIAKPVSKAELLARVKTHLENAFYYRELKQLNKNLEGLMKDFSRLSAKIHNSLKNKLESLQNFLSHSIKVYGNRDKLLENLRIAKNLVSHCSIESKNILFVTTHKECTVMNFLEELELQAGLTFPCSRIGYSISKDSLSGGSILKLEMVLGLLDVYSEILNNIVKHSGATAVDINIQCDGGRFILAVRDNGVGFDYPEQKDKKGSYGLNMMEELAQEIGALLYVESESGRGTMVRISAEM